MSIIVDKKSKKPIDEKSTQIAKKDANEQKMPSEEFSEQGRVRGKFPTRYPDEQDLNKSNLHKKSLAIRESWSERDARLPFDDISYEDHLKQHIGVIKPKRC